MRTFILGLLTAGVLLTGAAGAQASSATLTNIVTTTDRLTFDLHIDWSECKTYGFGATTCTWGASARIQEPDSDCVDPTNGVALWGSGLQTAPGVIDRSVTAPMLPGLRLTLCLWVYSQSSGQWTAAASAAVTGALPPPPPPEPWTVAEAKSSALFTIQQRSADAEALTATCKAGLSAVCGTTWSDSVSRWRGQITLTDQTATFAGQRASNACLKRHRTTCWHAVGRVWDPAQEPTVTPTR
jgi:hypothetical protein